MDRGCEPPRQNPSKPRSCTPKLNSPRHRRLHIAQHHPPPAMERAHNPSENPPPLSKNDNPVISATHLETTPTNKEILSDPILFRTHNMEIDHVLNSFQNSNQQTSLTQLDTTPATNTPMLPSLNSPKSLAIRTPHCFISLAIRTTSILSWILGESILKLKRVLIHKNDADAHGPKLMAI